MTRKPSNFKVNDTKSFDSIPVPSISRVLKDGIVCAKTYTQTQECQQHLP